jgi:predicted transcriptional regulator
MKLWINLPEGVMREARYQRGLSLTDVAEPLPVSWKTYERWEKANRVPGNMVEAVAEVLNLDLELPEKARVVLNDEDIMVGRQPTMAEIYQRLEAIEALLEAIRDADGPGAKRTTAVQ